MIHPTTCEVNDRSEDMFIIMLTTGKHMTACYRIKLNKEENTVLIYIYIVFCLQSHVGSQPAKFYVHTCD